ncbi:hypothetical protein JOM56_006657 [Amanita muscaria]
MAETNIVTAYPVAVPEKQEQSLPGLDKHITGVEYTKLEFWHNDGKPTLVEYKGADNAYGLKGKTAIITGGDSGIGRAVAIMFAREGCRAVESPSAKGSPSLSWGVGTPLHGRAGQPAELGPAYAFLASSDSNLMTGQVLHINSGRHIGAF